MKQLLMYDCLGIQKPKLYSDTKNLMQDLFAPGGSQRYQLRTQIRATHSGYLCNNRVYPGSHMRDSVGTWCDANNGGTAPYNKPVLIHHRQSDGGGLFGGGIPATDPIGRVVSASYTKLKDGIEFDNDYRNPASGTDLGSGFITLGALISDPDAIQKITDGRYDSVSVGFTTASAMCSICGQDWLSKDESKEYCEHQPGLKYEVDKKNYQCFLIAGQMDYREVSYVNVPAQPNARTLNNSLEAIKLAMNGDSSKPFVSYGDSSELMSMSIADQDGNTLDLMLKDDQTDKLPDIASKLRHKVIVQGVDIKVEPTPVADKNIDQWINKKDPETKTISDEHFAMLNVANSIIEAKLLDESETIDGCALTAKDVKALAIELKDAKLSVEQRKKLKSSSCCGPNSTFPVLDKDHVIAARKLLDRAKLSSEQKARVRSCVDRKAASMGLNMSKEDTKPVEPVKDNKVSDYVLETALEAITKERDELQTQVRNLQSALDAKVALNNELTDEVSKLKGERVKSAARQLAIINVNLQRPGTLGMATKEKFEAYVDSLAKRSYDSLVDSISDAMPEIDLLVKDKGSAQSKLADTKVDNPVIGRKDNQNVKKGTKVDENRDKAMSKNEYIDNNL